MVGAASSSEGLAVLACGLPVSTSGSIHKLTQPTFTHSLLPVAAEIVTYHCRILTAAYGWDLF